MVRVTVGVEAHTHEFIATAHEDQKFGFSLAGGQAAEAVEPDPRRTPTCSSCCGLHSHIGSQIFDTSGFEVSARRLIGLHAEVAESARHPHARAGPRRRLRHRLHVRAHAADPGRARRADGRPGAPRAQGRRRRQPGRRRPRGSRSSRGGPSSARARSPSTRSAPSRTSTSGDGAKRTYVSVDGGMSDNIRTALYDADYSCTLASRRSGRGAAARPRGRQALRERRHRRHGRVPARRHRRRGPDRRARARAPTAAAWPASTTTRPGRRWSRCATGRPGSSCAARRWTICWRWTSAEQNRDAQDRRPDAGTMSVHGVVTGTMTGVRDSPTGRKEQTVSESGRAESAGAPQGGPPRVWRGRLLRRPHAHPARRRPRRPRRPPPRAGRDRGAPRQARTAPTCPSTRRCSPPTPTSLVDAGRHRHRGHRRHRAGPQPDRAQGHEARRLGRVRQQGAARRGRPQPVRRGRRARRGPVLRGRGRRRHPDPAPDPGVPRR